MLSLFFAILLLLLPFSMMTSAASIVVCRNESERDLAKYVLTACSRHFHHLAKKNRSILREDSSPKR